MPRRGLTRSKSEAAEAERGTEIETTEDRGEALAEAGPRVTAEAGETGTGAATGETGDTEEGGTGT